MPSQPPESFATQSPVVVSSSTSLSRSTLAPVGTTTTSTTTTSTTSAAAAAAAATTTATTTTTTTTASTTSTTSTPTTTHSSADLVPATTTLFPPNKSPVNVFSAPPKTYKPDHLASIDLIIIVIYLCLLLSTSISTMIRTRKSHKRKAALAAAANSKLGGGGALVPATRNNFLASRKMNWFTVGASIFASNLGSEHFIGLSGSAAANGISVAAFEMNALIILQLATWIFLPVLISAKISTLPEYMSKRFGGKRIRTYLAILSILLYIFTKISVNLYSGGIFIQQAVGWNLYTSAMFILGLTCIMTLTGGLKGAMMIDNLQAIVMTVGASIVSASALVEIGGWSGLKTKYSMAVPSKVPANLTHCAQPNPRAFQMLRPADDRDMPWLGFLIGQTPASIWYWAADQMMVQRFLSARSLAHVQGSAVFAGYLKILPLVFMIIPGMISRCLYTDEVGCIDPLECQRYCQSSVSCSNTAYPRLVLELMPRGARGMMVAAMVAALMQDLCNVFNSASALFSCDIWPLCRKYPNQKEQETAGRVFVICLVFASIMWIPVIQEMQGGQLFIYIQAVAAMFWPPICAVYICAVMWKRTNEAGAFWSLMIGFMLGIIRMAMSFMYKEPSCGQHVDERPWLLKHVHYMYYAAFLFWATILCVVVISKLTRPPAPFRLIRTTFWTRFDTNIRRDDKNVFEMKYSGATTNSTNLSLAGDQLLATPTGSSNRSRSSIELMAGGPNGSAASSAALGLPSAQQQQQQQVAGGTTSPSASKPDDPTGGAGSQQQQQRLFTIEERGEAAAAAANPQTPPPIGGKRTPDLSSVIVDISKAAAATSAELAANSKKRQAPQVPQTAPIGGGGPFNLKGPHHHHHLQHQASLTASATAAVGEAGKFLASKFANTEANLRGARDIMLAAASHLTGSASAAVGATPDSRIRFKNLTGDEDDDEEDEDFDRRDEGDEEDDDEDDERTTNAADDSDEDDEAGQEEYNRKLRIKRNRRSQSVLSAALSSYKSKQRGGYQKALDEEDEEDEDDDDDDDYDEKVNLNRSASYKSKARAAMLSKKGDLLASNEVSSSTDDKQSPADLHGSSRPLTGTAGGVGPKKSFSKRSTRRSKRAGLGGMGSAGLGKADSIMKKKKNKKKSKTTKQKYEEEEDTESGRTYRCLDNSVSLLMKTRFEETILRIAVGAILLVATGIFILLSLPPAPPPKEIADILIRN